LQLLILKGLLTLADMSNHKLHFCKVPNMFQCLN